MKNKYGNYTTQPANVIERSYSNYDKIIIINQGSKSGIKVNMPVISDAGLVGHVISVDENTSKVQTIVDTASTVSTSISTIEQSVLAKGTIGDNNSLKLTSIPTDSTILQGDDVVTSGLGGIYPKGILIGTIGDNCRRITGKISMKESIAEIYYLFYSMVIKLYEIRS